ncbi:MAG: bifunctional adenosylcobinamide kinase/adenosylcobinamide-phosphate guanylyltransferase [Chloroflexi bacterium]|nr:bifunctional adenosylcobinamide kinase/adenosylcobinamide-phosphate guanylyltransferase [Chloroflexota bacterium]
MSRVVLVSGGARSGKSRFAERLLAHARDVAYVATAEAGDDEMRARIEEHRRSRPSQWRTIEATTRIATALDTVQTGAVLLEDLSILVSNHLLALIGKAGPTVATAHVLDATIADELSALLTLQQARGFDLVVVTNEVGLGIVPSTPLGRIFRDALGRANQAIAARAEVVYLLVAGIPLRLKPGCPTCADVDEPSPTPSPPLEERGTSGVVVGGSAGGDSVPDEAVTPLEESPHSETGVPDHPPDSG